MTKTLQEIKAEREQKVTALTNACLMFFAFSNKQFQENKTPLAEGEKYVSIGHGGYMPKSKVEGYISGIEEIGKWYKAAIKEHKLRKANIRYALNNHEAPYTGEIEGAMGELGEGYTEDEVRTVLRTMATA